MALATTVTVLMLHGGGFIGGSPGSVQPLADDLKAAGYNAIAVDYRSENPSGNVLGQIATVRKRVMEFEERGPVIAYGVSAGGTLAAALAATGEVAGAVVAGGPTDLVHWIGLSPLPTPQFWRRTGMSTADRRRASPIYRLNGIQSPQLLLYGDIDLLVPVEQGLNYNRASRRGQRRHDLHADAAVAAHLLAVLSPSGEDVDPGALAGALDAVLRRGPAVRTSRRIAREGACHVQVPDETPRPAACPAARPPRARRLTRGSRRRRRARRSRARG